MQSENELLYNGVACRVHFKDKEGSSMLAPISKNELEKRIMAELNGESPERRETTRKLRERGELTHQKSYTIG